MKKHILLFLLVFIISAVDAQRDMSDVDISVLSADSGDELYSTFGHTAIRIKDKDREIDQVFNWGTFDFRTPNFYMKFLRGQLPYRLGVSTYEQFLKSYNYQKRSVWEQKLDIADHQKEKILNAIQENLKPENREYTYDFFYDNCTTRAFDIVDQAADPLGYNNEIKDITFREMLKENLQSMPWTEFGIDLIIGAGADKTTTRKDQMFLPMYLHDQLNHTSVGADQKVVSDDYIVLDFIEAGKLRKASSTPWPLIVFSLMAFIYLIVYSVHKDLFRILSNIFLVLIAISSFVMMFMWFGTDHQATNNNWNLLWANPLILLYPFLKSYKWYYVILFVCLMVALLNGVVHFFPQYYHPAFIPIIFVIMLIVVDRMQHTTVSTA